MGARQLASTLVAMLASAYRGDRSAFALIFASGAGWLAPARREGPAATAVGRAFQPDVGAGIAAIRPPVVATGSRLAHHVVCECRPRSAVAGAAVRRADPGRAAGGASAVKIEGQRRRGPLITAYGLFGLRLRHYHRATFIVAQVRGSRGSPISSPTSWVLVARRAGPVGRTIGQRSRGAGAS